MPYKIQNSTRLRQTGKHYFCFIFIYVYKLLLTMQSQEVYHLNSQRFETAWFRLDRKLVKVNITVKKLPSKNFSDLNVTWYVTQNILFNLKTN